MGDNAGRVEHEALIDAALVSWTSSMSSTEVLSILEAVDVPSGPMYSVEDMVNDPQYQARGMFESVQSGSGEVTLPAILPKLDGTPGGTQWAGPGEVGGDSDAVFMALGYSPEQIKKLRQNGDI